MGTHVYSFQIRVLIYREDGEYCARALEMDLLGYGKTEKAAIKELSNLIECQLTFARQKDDDSLLLFPAEKIFFERWEAAHKAGLKNRVFPDRTVAMKVKAVCITLDETLKKLPKARFESLKLACA
jgi:hypothetical protein